VEEYLSVNVTTWWKLSGFIALGPKTKNSKIDVTACITFLLPTFLQGYLVTTVHDFFFFFFWRMHD
jgi:hypothetical protein